MSRILREAVSLELTATQRPSVGALGLDAELTPLIVPLDSPTPPARSRNPDGPHAGATADPTAADMD